MTDVHVVIGAAGATGRRVVAELVRAGRSVRAVTRDGRAIGVDGAQRWTADASDPASLAKVCRGASVVYHCAMPPLARWYQDFPPMTDALIDAAADAGARLVYADDTWMYGRVDRAMTPDLPYRPVIGKAALRGWLAERMRHAATAGRLPVSIVRAGELYGPGVRSLIAGNVFDGAARNGWVHWFGDPDQPITPTFIDDFAATLAVVGLGDRETASTWHVPHPEPTTGRQLAGLACRLSGTRLRLLAHGSRRLRLLGTVLPLAREGAELVYQLEQPFVVDGRGTTATFGLTPTPWAVGVAATLDRSGSAEFSASRTTTVSTERESADAGSTGAEFARNFR